MPDRQGVDTATLKLLIAILMNSPRDDQPHAVTGFWQLWSNTLYQLRLLDALLSLPGDTFNFVNLPGRKIVTVEDVAGASPTIKSLAANVQSHTWNSLDLFEVLVQAADSQNTEVTNFVREMLDKAVKISAELVHMGLLQVPVRTSVNNSDDLVLMCYVAIALERDPSGLHSAASCLIPCRAPQPSTRLHANLANQAGVSHKRLPRLL